MLCALCCAVQALVAHLINLWDKTLLFRSCAAQSGCSVPRQLLLLLSIRGSCRLSLPVLRENLSRVLRGAGGAGAGLGATLHLSSAEEVPDDDSDAVSATRFWSATRFSDTRLSVHVCCWTEFAGGQRLSATPVRTLSATPVRTLSATPVRTLAVSAACAANDHTFTHTAPSPCRLRLFVGLLPWCMQPASFVCQ